MLYCYRNKVWPIKIELMMWFSWRREWWQKRREYVFELNFDMKIIFIFKDIFNFCTVYYFIENVSCYLKIQIMGETTMALIVQNRLFWKYNRQNLSCHLQLVILENSTTGIPRLPRFLVARFHFARIFLIFFLYYKHENFFDNFLWLYYDSRSANFT